MIALAVLLAACGVAHGTEDEADEQFAPAIELARARVVKIYGPRGGREAGYGSGVIVSPDGKIVTVLSTMLEDEAPRVVLDDGRRFFAAVIARDPRRQLALLKIDASELPHFSLGSSEHLQPGDWVISAANPFKVAEGPEAVSIAAGVFAGRAPLAARRRKQDYPYDGAVLLVDLLVSTPGSAGGALTDAGGNLVGILGKQVTSTRTNTWLNYAMPVEEVAAFMANPLASEGVESAGVLPTTLPTAAADLGILLFNVGGRQRPAYVERVRSGSPAALAGVATDDLILSIAGQPIATCDDYLEIVRRLRPGQEVDLVVKRGDEVIPLKLLAGARSP